jgi:hypothetical protein
VYVCTLDRPGARPAGIIDSQFEQLRVDVQVFEEEETRSQGP